MEQVPEEYKGYTKLSTRFGNVFYDDKIIVPQTLRRTIITLLHNQQNVRGSKTILVAETNKGDTKQMRRMHTLQNDRCVN